MDFISILDRSLMWQLLNWISGAIMWVSFFFGLRFLISGIALNKRTDIFLCVHFFTLFGLMLIAHILFDSTNVAGKKTKVKEAFSIHEILKKY